jgi:hypothetical protein
MRDLEERLDRSYFTDRETNMPRKPASLTFDQAIDALRKQGFEVSSAPGKAGGMRVSKYGVAATLVPAQDGGSSAASLAEHPGILVRGQVARLLDRGYQKFIRTAQFELPATAAQLHAIHQFTEELTQATGGTSLYNQSLGTTSDVYLYDRLRGREDEAGHPAGRPWELTEGH